MDVAVVRSAARQGLRTLIWSVDTRDWQRPSPAIIAKRALAARAGDVILLHDGGGDRSRTVAALPRILRGLRARGLRVVTASQLLRLAQGRASTSRSSR
jgi:peptidoglycan/xylan/chitin deacetylase (PgdA/CDA1 family)